MGIVAQARKRKKALIKQMTFDDIVKALEYWNSMCIYGGDEGHEASLLVERAIDTLHTVQTRFSPKD